MNGFDLGVIHFLNAFARHSALFDNVMVFLSGNNLLKGGVLVSLMWWVWFKDEERRSDNRQYLISTLIASLISVVVARALALLLPFRNRPMHEDGVDFVLPFGLKPETLDGWSSFPSDHATLFFCLSAGLTFISRRLGTFAFAYTAAVITFPRWYLGLHYPTDSLAGAAVGIVIAALMNRYVQPSRLIQKIVDWSETSPALFYPAFFLLNCQIVTMFTESRGLARAVFLFIQRALT